MKYQRPPKEWQVIFNQEWKRAKKLCSPFFDNTDKPKLYTKKVLGRNWLGMHSGRDGMMHKINGKWLLQSSHIITLRIDHPPETLRDTMKHEICHVKYHNHKAGFKLMLHGLKEKTTSPEVV